MHAPMRGDTAMKTLEKLKPLDSGLHTRAAVEAVDLQLEHTDRV